MNIFENATRSKFRFASKRGELTTEQLWDLPLTSKDGFDLDTVAKGVNAALKSVTEESFVNTVPHPRKAQLEQELEVVKHVIAVKIAEKDAALKKAAAAEERRKLLEALGAKEDEALRTMSKDEILKRLSEIDG